MHVEHERREQLKITTRPCNYGLSLKPIYMTYISPLLDKRPWYQSCLCHRISQVFTHMNPYVKQQTRHIVTKPNCCSIDPTKQAYHESVESSLNEFMCYNRNKPTFCSLSSLHCTISCKANTNNMIKCCLCSTWYHMKCLKLGENDIGGAWNCPECGRMPSNVKVIDSKIDTLTELVRSLIQTRNEDRKTYRKNFVKLEEENALLQRQN